MCVEGGRRGELRLLLTDIVCVWEGGRTKAVTHRHCVCVEGGRRGELRLLLTDIVCVWEGGRTKAVTHRHCVCGRGGGLRLLLTDIKLPLQFECAGKRVKELTHNQQSWYKLS